MNSTQTEQIKARAKFLKLEKAAHDADYARRCAAAREIALAKIAALQAIEAARAK
jgi:hypothetical protein